MGAAREIREFVEFLERQRTQNVISEFCSTQSIEWKFIPERAPHFGGLWEATVKRMKTHLKRVVGSVKLTVEEFSHKWRRASTVDLSSLLPDDDGIEAITPGHFLIGRPLEALLILHFHIVP